MGSARSRTDPTGHLATSEILSPSAATNKRITALDGLRGWAILLVMFHHFTFIPAVDFATAALVNLASFGPHGVDLFFVLSGFLITGILLDTSGHNHFFRNFYMRRVLRIFPLCYFVLILSVFVLPILSEHIPQAADKVARFATAKTDWPWYTLYLSNVLVAISKNWRHPVLGVTWSLAIEEQFYLVWPMVVFLCTRKTLRRLVLSLAAVSALLRIGLVLAGTNWIQVYVSTPCRFDGLAIGAWLAIMWRTPGNSATRLDAPARWIAYFGTPALLGLYCSGIFAYDTPLTQMLGYPLVIIVCAAWLWRVIHASPASVVGRLTNAKIMRFLGKYSYGIYLFHLPVSAAILYTIIAPGTMYGLLGDSIRLQIAFYLVALAAVIPCALLSWRYLEAPALGLRRYFPR